MPDEKMERDTRKQFSQMDMDAATKPLHAEIERLKVIRVGDPVYFGGEVFRPANGYPSIVFPPSSFLPNREVRDGDSGPRQSRWVPERVPVPAFDNEPPPPNRLLVWLKSWIPRRSARWNGVGSYPPLPLPIPPPPAPPPGAVSQAGPTVVANLSDDEIQRVAERVVRVILRDQGGIASQLRQVGRG